jgi:mannan endo-1,4-beta-mannosidase
LDFVVSEAKKNGIRLLLSLVNNYGDYGGKPQYVAWANQNGGNLNSEDDFFSDATIRSWFQDYIKVFAFTIHQFNSFCDSTTTE